MTPSISRKMVRGIGLLLLSLVAPFSSGFVLPRHVRSLIKGRDSLPSWEPSTRTYREVRGPSSSRISMRLGAVISPNKRKVELALQSNNYLRGKLLVVVSKFFKSPTFYWEAVGKILSNTYWPEVALITVMANALPITEWCYVQKEWRRSSRKPQQEQSNNQVEITNGMPLPTLTAEEEEEQKEEEMERILQRFQASPARKLALILEQIGFLQGALYVSDVVLVFLKLLDFEFVIKYQAQKVAGSILFSTWLAYNLSRLKFYYLKNGIPAWSLATLRRQRQQQQKARIQKAANGNNSNASTMGVYNRFANRILDVIIYLCAFLAVVDLLGIQIGFALKSIFGLGSFGTLVFSLASKDVAAEFVGGLMIQSSNFFDEGETVVLQDGTAGSVLKIGWLHTYIRKDDGYLVRVPNSQISHQRIARQQRTASTSAATNGRRTNNKRFL